MTDIDLDELRDELDAFAKPKKEQSRSPRDERIIAGFEEIQQFVEEHNREPSFGEKKDIFERLYATRLEQIRRQKECIEILQDRDHQNLLSDSNLSVSESENDLDDDELLGELGLTAGDQKSDITQLKLVKPRAEVSKSA